VNVVLTHLGKYYVTNNLEALNLMLFVGHVEEKFIRMPLHDTFEPVIFFVRRCKGPANSYHYRLTKSQNNVVSTISMISFAS